MLRGAPQPGACGTLTMVTEGPLVAGMRTSIRFVYTVEAAGLARLSRLRIGLPNTGWERPVVPQQRYWDELVQGQDRRLAPFHPVNTTASFRSARQPGHLLEVMERMLLPDVDPAIAYWRWWITLTLEEADLEPGDKIEILYGDRRFGSEGARVQTFPETSINISGYLDADGKGVFVELPDSPIYFDVITGPAVRANVVVPSMRAGQAWKARISLTDECQCIPRESSPRHLSVQGHLVPCFSGSPSFISGQTVIETPLRIQATGEDGQVWGTSNPAVPLGPDGLHLYWGDLHAQSEHHVMHSQGKDFHQESWSKGISCGTLDECYQYAREVSLLDFVAITDQGACLTRQWEYCQEKVRGHHRHGEFVVFKGYEAGSPLGHRNVIYLTDEVEPPLDGALLHGFHPQIMFEFYRGRQDVMLIPHHVKTWTDWSLHDPALEQVMEVYSCWGQSESAGLHLWEKGQTPGAGAWEAFRRGYRLGMMASSDNHVGMPGRSYPGDRQNHTPFKAGLCAVWAEDLSRASLFAALRLRRCYGTTGDRIILRFAIGAHAMGSIVPVSESDLPLDIAVYGTDALDRIELVQDLQVTKRLQPDREEAVLIHTSTIPAQTTGCFYVRVFQKNGECGWSSPIWIE